MTRRRTAAGGPLASKGVISAKLLANAVVTVEAMNTEARIRLADEIYEQQPNLLASVLALPRMGVSLDQLEVLITVLLVTWQTMKTSGRKWPLISEDTLERCLQRLTGKRQFIAGLSPALQQRAVDDQINQHAEPQLLAFVHGYLGDHGLLGIGTDAEKYLVLAGLNLAECVAETVPKPTRST